MDEKGRKVINVPFQMLKRNFKWKEEGQKPFLPPEEKDMIKPEDQPDPNPGTANEDDDKIFLGVEDDDGTDDPEVKKRKLHFGGLNFKKKVIEETKSNVDFTADNDFDTWWFTWKLFRSHFFIISLHPATFQEIYPQAFQNLN